MSKYTPEEIIEDIRQFEEVKIELTTSPGAYFLKLYSEYYDSPLLDNTNTDELEDRIDYFIKECVTPNMNEPPSNNNEFVTYYLEGDLYIKYGEYNTIEEASIILDDTELVSTEVLIYVKEDNEFNVYVRDIH